MVRLRVGDRPERVAVQPLHVEHRPEIDRAAEDRVGGAEAFHEALDRHRQQRVDRRVAERREIGAAARGGVERPGGGDLPAAHRDCAVEQAVSRRHAHQGRDLRPAAGLSEHHHPAGIAAEIGDVVADPLEREDEVELPRISAVGEASIEAGETEGREQQLGRIGPRRVGREPGGVGVAMRADDRQRRDRFIKAAGDPASRGVGRQEPVRMEAERLRHDPLLSCCDVLVTGVMIRHKPEPTCSIVSCAAGSPMLGGRARTGTRTAPAPPACRSRRPA